MNDNPMFKSLGAKLSPAMAKFGSLHVLEEYACICEVAAIGHGGHTDRQRIFFEKLGSETRALITRMQQFRQTVEQMSDETVQEIIEVQCDLDITTALWGAMADTDPDEPKDSDGDPDEPDRANWWKEGHNDS